LKKKINMKYTRVLEQLHVIDETDLWAVFTAGCCVGFEEKVEIAEGCEVYKRVREEFRVEVALFWWSHPLWRVGHRERPL
jgi:hypothetical protein